MQKLQTIEEVQKLFQTSGSSPILVTCNDLRDWVCKYDRSTKNLFNELLASKFAEIWGIPTPETAFIHVKKEHVPTNKFPKIGHHLLEKECFGSLYLQNSKEIDSSLIPLFKKQDFKNNLQNKEDFLKIALFDIWIANEDRNHNNFNLLLNVMPDKMKIFYAIDHVNIFNSSFLNYGIADITEDDSIIKTDLAKILFEKNKGLEEIVDTLVKNLYLYSKKCQTELDTILDLIPESWEINLIETKEKILHNIFNIQWNQKCESNFREFIQSFIVN